LIKHDDAYLRRVTDYWRRIQVAAALEDIKDERDGTDEEDRKENIIRAEFSYDKFVAGRCPESVFSRAFARLDKEQREAFDRARSRGQNPDEPEPAKHISVVFSPFALIIKGQKNPVNVLFGTAKVDRSGGMSVEQVDSDLPPVWIGRGYLSPSDGIENDFFPLADADAYCAAIASKLDDLGTWPVEWSFMLAAFEHIWERAATRNDKPSAIPLYESLKPAFMVKSGWIRFERNDPKRLDIIRMYQRLLVRIDKKQIPALFREAALSEHQRVFDKPDNALHLGQMGGKHALAPSQRTSLLAHLQTPNGHVTAINGPPGTGKTTLLQSVIASEMVRCAIAQGPPPLYVAAAATNQAVANVIKAFREATDDLDHPLADRWIPGLGRRYGAYFRGSKGEGPSLAQGSIVCLPMQFNTHREYDEDGIAKLIKEIDQRNKNNDEVPVDLFLLLAESERVKAQFIETANANLQVKCLTIDDVIKALHSKLLSIKHTITSYAQAADGFLATIRDLGLETSGSYEDAEKKLALRLLGARHRVQGVFAQNAAERDSDDRANATKLSAEASSISKFDASEDHSEGVTRQTEDAKLGPLQERIKHISAVGVLYQYLGPPKTMWAWISETCFPWVKNAKTSRLQQLSQQLGQARTHSNNLFSLRESVESGLLENDALTSEEARIQAVRSARSWESANRRNTLLKSIKMQRDVREQEMLERARMRLTALHQAEEAVRTTESNIVQLRRAKDALVKTIPQFKIDGVPPFGELTGWIDRTERLEAFLLASHYWEARFLKDAPKSGWRSQGLREHAFRAVAMLTPCFVSTFDKLGSSFNIMRDKVVHPLWEFADALIIDEAGQASPDKGAFAFAFAKKALVVGDELQLPPVNSSDAVTILASIATKSGLTGDEFATEHGLLTGKIGVQRISGSIMRMASSAAYFDSARTTRGMWLRDHFRCDPRIIAFSNRIWYTGDTALIPRRLQPKGTPVPHFGHVHIAGKEANLVNRDEIQAILEWINCIGPNLESHYDLPIHEILAVLTPFTNQKHALQNTRNKTFEWNPVFEKPQRITMGSVHALQGAERPVVLFSTVYDEPKMKYFFDSEHTLLNVAVSRAKDSFIVFGNKCVFPDRAPEISRPSTFLREHLFDRTLAAVPMTTVPIAE